MAVTRWPRSLGWSEFQEISSRPSGVNENAQIGVITDMPSSGIRVARDGRSFKVEDIEIPLVVQSTETWVVTGTKTNDLLSHEQGHFDIAGLVAWELYRAILATRAPSVTALSERINAHVERAGRKLHALSGSDGEDGKYDKETRHGLDAAEQKRWKDLISDAMNHNNRALPDS